MSGNRFLEALRGAWMLLAFAVLVAGLLPPPAGAQEAGVPALNQALLRLTQVQHDMTGVRTVAYQRVGPFELHTQCTYCSRDFLGICTEKSTANWRHTVDLGWPGDAEAQADGYAHVQTWIAALPALSASFDANADIVLGVEQAIRQGVGPNEQQRRDATQALLALTNELGRSSMQLDAGVRTLAVSIARQGRYRRAIRHAIDGSDQSAQIAWRELDAASRKQRCTDSVQAQFDAIRGEVSRATQQVASAIEQLDASDRQAEQALAQLLGAVISARTEVESVLRLLAAADTDQLGSLIERLHLAAAKNQWQALAKTTAP